jgi:small conductance mechanosensitive channel
MDAVPVLSALARTVVAAQPAEPARYSSDWWLDVLVGRPSQVVLIGVLAVVARWLVFRLIDTFVTNLAYRRPSKRGRPARLTGAPGEQPRDEATAEQAPPAPTSTGVVPVVPQERPPAEPRGSAPLRRWWRSLWRRLRHRGADRPPPKRYAVSPPEAELVYEPAEATYRERKIQRAATVGQLLRSIATLAIVGVAVVMILDVLGLPVAPLLASAGIVGAAVGFGAQNLVRDFVSGVFMLIEDQYGVGDVIDMGQASGVVESVSLRVTGLRDENGTMWWVRNGEVLRVGNKSQGWARAVVDVTVGPGDDLDEVRELLRRTADAMAAEPEWADQILEAPEIAGVEQLTRDTAVLRMTVTTPPGEQFAVQRELRGRLSRALLVQQPE